VFVSRHVVIDVIFHFHRQIKKMFWSIECLHFLLGGLVAFVQPQRILLSYLGHRWSADQLQANDPALAIVHVMGALYLALAMIFLVVTDEKQRQRLHLPMTGFYLLCLVGDVFSYQSTLWSAQRYSISCVHLIGFLLHLLKVKKAG